LYLFKVLFKHLPGITEQWHEKQSGRPVSTCYLKLGPPEYKTGVLTTQPQHYVIQCYRWNSFTAQ